jgi:hypothetical protein
VGAGAGDGAALPPLEPDPELDPGVLVEPELSLLFDEESGVVTPPVTGVVEGWKVGTGCGFDPPPPLDAIAITTIRKKTAATTATSRRRR